jgi:uncharacterized protein YjbI with pentapeptide repeats
MAGADLGRFGVLDYWMFKPQAEVLVTGACHTGERPKGSEYVRLSVGPQDKRLIDKRLYVFGDRKWTLLGPSDPQMFTKMPIDYAHAFGGEKSPVNPIGKGMQSVKDETGSESVPLPNVEDPKHVIKSKGDKPPPASFAGWDLTWPAHFEKKMGTYSFDWVEKNGFSLADDIDFSLFNVAPNDQRAGDSFAADEELRVENMHPDKRVQDVKLPGFWGRCLVKLKEKFNPEGTFKDVPLKLDTLHLFPHQERVIAFFRGVVEINTTDATDVELVVAALEGSEKKSIEHYESIVRLRLDKERGGLYSLRDRDLMPAEVESDNTRGLRIGDPLEEALKPEFLLRERMNRRIVREQEKAREEMLASGVDPALVPAVKAPEPSPDANANLEELPELVERIEKERTQAEKLAEEKRAEAMSQLESTCKEYDIDLAKLLDESKKDKAGPPKFSAEGEMEKLEQQLQLATNAGLDLPHVREMLADPNLRARLLDAQQRLYQGYRLTAHMQDEVEPLSEQDSLRAQAELVSVLSGTPRDRRDFTGANLAGMDLSGIELEGAFLESADLRGANLSKAKLKDAVLARANLEGANLKGADLEHANLGRAKLKGADLSEANLTEANLYQCELVGVNMTRAKMTKAQTLEVVANGTDFSGVAAEQLVFFRAKLNDTKFRGSRMHLCIFHECEASRIDASNADFSQSVFLMSTADDAKFAGSMVENFRMVMSSFRRADFTGAKMPGSNLRGAKLDGAKFGGVNLRRSDLSGADLRGAHMDGALLVECLLLDTNLSGASMKGTNLMLSIMHRANLRGADVSKSNLFCADLTGAEGDDKTSFSGSNVKRALVAGVYHG